MVLDESLFEEEKEEIHLRDMIKGIDYFLLFDDIDNAHYELNEALDEEDTKTISLLGMTDEQLAELKKEDIKEINNVELLYRLAKINRNKLTPEQIEIIEKDARNKIVISKEDVEDLLEKFRKCNKIYYGYPLKTREFLREYDLTEEDVLYVIKNLTVEDYYANTRNIARWHEGNHLIIFEPSNVKLENGRELGDITLYIKLDIDETTNNAIAMISFHGAEFDNKLPYKKDKDNEEEKMKVEKLEKKQREIDPKYVVGKRIEEGMKSFLRDLGKEEIQYFKLVNKFNYDIKQLRVDNKNKTYEIGNFKIIRRPNVTNNGAEFKRLIDELSTRGYSEVKNELTEDLLLNPTKEDEENVKELLDKYKGTKYEKVLNNLKAKYNFENTAKEYKTEEKKSKFKEDLEYMKKSKFQEDLEEPNFKENLSGNMTIEEIAKKHKVPVEEIEKQVEIGIKVEKEHTDNEEEAKRIALDHLFEIADYYDRLTKMEDEAKKELKEDAEETITEVKPVEPLNQELIQKLEDKIVEFRNRYLFDEEDIKIKVDEENPRKIWFLGELTHNKQSELADELDEIVKEYDEDSYFDAEDSGRWFAIIRTEEEKENNKEELKKTYQEIINKLSPLTDDQKETLKRDIEKDGLFVKELDDGKLLVVKEIEESVEGDKIAQDYIDSKNANYEADKQNEREVKLELAKQGITESLEDITKEKVEEIAKRNNVPIRFLDDTGIRFVLETTNKELVNKFYKEFSELAGTKETIVVEDKKEIKEELSETEQSKYGLVSLVNDLIKDELDAINSYNSAIVTFEAENKGEYTDVIRDIIKEENTHVGQLQAILKGLQPESVNDIEGGQEEGEEQLAEQEHPLDESLKK